mgnify:FL=1
MILTYAEAIKEYGNAYQLSRVMESGQLYKQEDGIYSTRKYEPELSIIMKKYPKAVLTGEYAFYCHGLTNVIPEKYELATPSKSAQLKDRRIHQIYMRDDIFPLGIIEKEIDGASVKMYDRERMLIELLRNKNKMPYDLYKEILLNYRNIIEELELWRVQEYASVFPKSKMISKALDAEVL